MQKRTVGTIVSAKKQWWLKVNTKAIRKGPLDGATFPYIAKIKYTIDGTEYVKNKWMPGAGRRRNRAACVRRGQARKRKNRVLGKSVLWEEAS